jgi:L-lactate permease
MQPILIGLLLLSMILIAQQFDRGVYRVGMLLLIGTTLIQMTFGNIPPQANVKQTMKYLLIGFAILGSVVAASILLVPTLLQIGRGG